MKNFLKTISSGNAEILDSGTVISYDKEPIVFAIGEDGNLKIKIEFLDDETKAPSIKSADVEDDTTLNLVLANFNNPLGSGTNQPLSIGVWENKKLSIGFRVYALEGSDQKTFHFTFYKHE